MPYITFFFYTIPAFQLAFSSILLYIDQEAKSIIGRATRDGGLWTRSWGGSEKTNFQEIWWMQFWKRAVDRPTLLLTLMRCASLEFQLQKDIFLRRSCSRKAQSIFQPRTHNTKSQNYQFCSIICLDTLHTSLDYWHQKHGYRYASSLVMLHIISLQITYFFLIKDGHFNIGSVFALAAESKNNEEHLDYRWSEKFQLLCTFNHLQLMIGIFYGSLLTFKYALDSYSFCILYNWITTCLK